MYKAAALDSSLLDPLDLTGGRMTNGLRRSDDCATRRRGMRERQIELEIGGGRFLINQPAS